MIDKFDSKDAKKSDFKNQNLKHEQHIKTKRLILRNWQEPEFEPFAALNADPRVREFFPGLISSHESHQSIKKISDHISEYGLGVWAASLIETGEFIGILRGVQK